MYIYVHSHVIPGESLSKPGLLPLATILRRQREQRGRGLRQLGQLVGYILYASHC